MSHHWHYSFSWNSERAWKQQCNRHFIQANVVSLWPVCYDSLQGQWKQYRKQTHNNYILVAVVCICNLCYRAMERFNIRFLGIVKTNHARFPKQFIESTIKNWPARSHIVLEGSSEDDINLLVIGYKYNSKKILCFVSTKNVGSTEPTCYYEARWLDKNGNTMSRRVPRPKIINDYFSHSNAIDRHNHVRQFLLRLEKHWKTEDGYFRIITTIFGICITDAWKAYRFHIGNRHRHKQMTIDDFADLLCHDCLNNKFTDVIYEDSILDSWYTQCDNRSNGQDTAVFGQ